MLYLLSFATLGQTLCAQDARQYIQLASKAELAANRSDNSHWRYIDHHTDESGNKEVTVVVETEHGALRRHLEQNGKPPTRETLQAEDEHNQKFIHDPGMQQKQRKDGLHDEKSEEELTAMLPDAFLWSIVQDTPETVTLAYKPNTEFHPPNIEARVMGAMVGTVVVYKAGYRIKTLKGMLGEDVTIGYGILGRLRKGGTFDVERSQLAPGLWQVTESHVHISGRALFFKSIGQQDDEVKTNFTPVSPATTLEQGVQMLQEPRQP